jgi:hemerythrin superfamily protein
MATTTPKTQKADVGAGGLIAAAAAGAALAIAGNMGRKAIAQGATASAGDWDEVLAAEHELTMAIFDKMLATSDNEKRKRGLLLTQLSHALDKHAYAEEHVLYAALREEGDLAVAEHLENDHGAVKAFLYKLARMEADDARWIETVRVFRESVKKHADEEEETVFPRLKSRLDAKENKRLTKDLNKAGFYAA